MYANDTNTLLPQALQLIQFNGMSNPAVREWRFNSTFAYNFGAGWRGGFSTRLREKRVVSYATRPITSSTANNIDVKEPRVSFYGWTNPNLVTTINQVQDPREVAFSVPVDF